ncbi:LmeA family phospholipid-binding protein [Clavibacter nebraskensis]|uniref:LmeA family phospholipid-binding protein n=1 Tax=Clavibacter nebraskensis TaxID=31963 RepID=UPI003F8265F6
MAGRFLGTEVFEAPERRDPREARRRRRGPRGGTVFIWLLVLAVIGVGLAFGLRIVDQTVRGVAEEQAEKQIADQLPGQVTGRVNVAIEGEWVIPQLIRGRLDRVVLDGPNLQADGTPFQAHVVATDVPTDQERTVGDVVATVSMDQEPASALLARTAGTPPDLRFGDGTLGYSGSTRVLGLTLGYTVAAEPVLRDGSTVVITPAQVELQAGSLKVDLAQTIQGIRDITYPVCIAQYLPAGVAVQDVTVADGRASMTVESSSLKLTRDSLGVSGSCG